MSENSASKKATATAHLTDVTFAEPMRFTRHSVWRARQAVLVVVAIALATPALVWAYERLSEEPTNVAQTPPITCRLDGRHDASTEQRLYPVDARPWSGVEGYEAARGELPRDTFTPLRNHVFAGDYRIVPQLRGHDDPHVVYYLAYNTRTEQNEVAIGPDALQCFRESVER